MENEKVQNLVNTFLEAASKHTALGTYGIYDCGQKLMAEQAVDFLLDGLTETATLYASASVVLRDLKGDMLPF